MQTNMDVTKVVHDSAIVVEGGAMRGIFAAGILDSFLDNNFSPFEWCFGVSAGATNLASYMSKQRGRSHRIITDYSCRPHFFNVLNYLRGRHYIDLDWLWKLAYREYRLDAFAYSQHKSKLLVTTTDIQSGTAVYTQPSQTDLEQVLLASCAVPFAYRRFPAINGMMMTDGGVSDSIPVIEAYNRGARHILVILSQAEGYVKKPSKFQTMIRLALWQLPNLANALFARHTRYNEAIEFINNPPADCTIEILRPTAQFAVGRTTRDQALLAQGYEMGILAGQQYVESNTLAFSQLNSGVIVNSTIAAAGENYGVQELAQ